MSEKDVSPCVVWYEGVYGGIWWYMVVYGVYGWYMGGIRVVYGWYITIFSVG